MGATCASLDSTFADGEATSNVVCVDHPDRVTPVLRPTGHALPHTDGTGR